MCLKPSAPLPVRAVACLVLWAAVGAVQPAAAEGWHVGALFTTDYVQRGLSQNDGKPALQAGATYTSAAGVYAGVWGATVSNGRTALRDAAGRFEVNFLAGYARPWRETLDFDVALLRYEYPDSDAPVDYGYTELSASAGYRGLAWLTGAVSRDATLFTRRGPERNITTFAWELAGEVPLSSRLGWIGGAGYLDFRRGTANGYAYFNTGFALRLDRLDVELQYIDTSRGEELFGRRLAGPRLVLSLMGSF
jgi:uncharacterized protein (TIGR02001 family)